MRYQDIIRIFTINREITLRNVINRERFCELNGLTVFFIKMDW